MWKKVSKKPKKKLQPILQELEKIQFACEPDANAEKERFLKGYSKTIVYPELKVVCEEEIKRPVGRPGKNPKPPVIVQTWKIKATNIERNESIIEQKKKKASTFSLLTNISVDEMRSEEILLAYKGQGKVEHNFKILKEPLMAATIFLEKDTRIAALMTLLYFSALMHGLLRVLTHIELEKLPKPPRINSNNRLLVRPTSDTMIWLLSLFTIRSNDGGYEIDSSVNERREQPALLFKLTRFNVDFIGPQ
jgi:transposase